MANPMITALLYSDSVAADAMLRTLALDLLERGIKLAGLVQQNRPRPGRSRCDMVLEDLATGESLPISQDRGAHARGCALDHGQLAVAIAMVSAALDEEPDLVIINKFGKSESEGGGFRQIIADALARDIPLLIAVPFRNLENWRAFAGDFSHEINLEDLPRGAAELRSVLGLDKPAATDRQDGEAPRAAMSRPTAASVACARPISSPSSRRPPSNCARCSKA